MQHFRKRFSLTSVRRIVKSNKNKNSEFEFTVVKTTFSDVKKIPTISILSKEKEENNVYPCNPRRTI